MAKARTRREAAPEASEPAEPPRLAAEWTDLTSLIPWPKNPRKNEQTVARIARSIAEFGWGRPLVARAANRELVIGHTAHAAARLLAQMLREEPADVTSVWHVEALHTARTGQVPVRFVDLSETDAHALAVADNKLGEFSSWSEDLGAILAEIDPERERIDIMGWTNDELDNLLADLVKTDEDEEEEKPPPAENAITKPGERIEFEGGHTLYCVDSSSAEMFEIVDRAKPRMMVMDPPFDIDYSVWKVPESVEIIYCWSRAHHGLKWATSLGIGPDGWAIHDIVFYGGQSRSVFMPYFPFLCHETVYVLRRRDGRTSLDRRALGRVKGLRTSADGRHHSVQDWLVKDHGMKWGKPVRCMEVGMAYAPIRSLCWDPCAGGGSTLLAAQRQRRRWIGCEREPGWCDLIVNRWQEDTGLSYRRIPPGTV
jgi:hypothetical protein